MFKYRSFGQKLIMFFTVTLIIASVIIGISSYLVARNALIDKGKIILKNSVKSALMMIDDMNKDVLEGTITLEEAQENLKQYLLGPLNPDGTRQITSQINFGEHGYYIVYSQTGIELMHPTLEGSNVWYFKDKGNVSKPFYLVQDKIKKAQNGGGFTEYTWEYPFLDKLGRKIVYSELDPHWGWVVTAGSYISDFDAGALKILLITFATMIIVIILGYIFVNRYITSITQPLIVVSEAMKDAEKGNYRSVPPVEIYDELGNLINGFNAMIQSIDTAQKNLIKKDDQLLQYAYYDALSGLPNAYYFKKTVSERLKLFNGKAALLLVDIKDFNIINSIYGTAYGDKIIEYLGKTVKEETALNKLVSRISGNEFAIWLEEIDDQTIISHTNTYFEKLKRNMQMADFTNHIDFYTSLVEVEDRGVEFDHMYKRASTALQYSKNNGQLSVLKYREEMYQELERESILLTLAEASMDTNQFTIHYQNKVDTNTGKVTGVESLSRWHSPVLGYVSPAEFIPVLYKSNLMVKFSHIVIDKVLNDIPKLKQLYGETCTVSINVSPVSFFNESFVELLRQSMQERNIKPNCVIIEITEDVFISDFDVVKSRIEELKAIGVMISLDDFGTGYSSLNYLSKIKFDEIKVDKSFIDNIHTDETSLSLFKAIVKIAKALDCEVVAEGVESEAQVNAIVNAGCNVIQGYVYSRPMPLRNQ